MTTTGGVDISLQATEEESASGMQIEIPYVPESQRKTTKVVEDSIVVVGQARQKKRKRTRTVVDADLVSSAEGSQLKTEEGGVTQEPFDFSAVPNILDDIPNTEDMRHRKKKKQKQNKGVCERGLYCIFFAEKVGSQVLVASLGMGISPRRRKLIVSSKAGTSRIHSSSVRCYGGSLAVLSGICVAPILMMGRTSNLEPQITCPSWFSHSLRVLYPRQFLLEMPARYETSFFSPLVDTTTPLFLLIQQVM